MFLRIIIFTSAILALIGCDRVQYEIRNNENVKSVSKIYTNLVRVPLPGQIQICADKEKSNGEVFFRCMVNAGFKENEEFSMYWNPIVSSNVNNSNLYGGNKSFVDEINKLRQFSMRREKSSTGPEFWLENN